MRYILTMVILILLTINGYSQIEEICIPDSIIIDSHPVDYSEMPPKFPGGIDSLWCFIETNLDFEILNHQDKQGKVLAIFEIDTSGKVINLDINPDYTHHFEWLVKDSLIENEIERVLNQTPNWEPGYQRDIPVKCGYALPIIIPYINFKCADKDKL